MKKQTNLPAGSRKLSLNKKTISNLTTAEMSGQMAGSYTLEARCGTQYCTWTCKGKTCNRRCIP